MDARQLPHVWKWFCVLPLGSDFLIGTEVFFKAGLFLADSAERRYTAVVWPFRRVRTTQPVRDALPGGLSSADLEQAVRRTVRHSRSFFEPVSNPRDIVDAARATENLYGRELRDRYSDEKPYEAEELRKTPFMRALPPWTGRLTHTVCGDEKPFADDGRTGPSA